MREIVLDTETTGLDPSRGDRVVEIGCVELVNHIPSGLTYHQYINPERDMPEEAFRVHGLSISFLEKHPVFADIAADFLAFIGDAPLVIHNAEFDMRFLNAELARLDHPALPPNRAIDTVRLARRKFPGAQVNLDALCRRFSIDNTERVKHGALLDAELLAEVYLELLGGRQTALGLDLSAQAATGAVAGVENEVKAEVHPPRVYRPNQAELDAHAKFLNEIDSPLWRDSVKS